MVAAHLEPAAPEVTVVREQLIAEFIRKQDVAVLANDQILNALLMATSAGLWNDENGRRLIDKHLLRPLDQI